MPNLARRVDRRPNTNRLARTLESRKSSMALAALAAGIPWGCLCGPVSSLKPSPGSDGTVYGVPKNLISVVVTIGETAAKGDQPAAWKVSVDVESDLVADPTHRFTLSRSTNVLFDDDVNLTVAREGLLESLTMTSTDQTPKIFSDLVDTGIDLYKFQAVGGVAGLTKGSGATKSLPLAQALAAEYLAQELEHQLKPLAGSHRRHWSLPESGPIRTTFADFPGPGWSIDIELVRADQAGVVEASAGTETVAPEVPASGVFVRGLEPFVVRTRVTPGIRISANMDVESFWRFAVAEATRKVEDAKLESERAKRVANAYATLKHEDAAKMWEEAHSAQRDYEIANGELEKLDEQIRPAIHRLARRQGLVLDKSKDAFVATSPPPIEKPILVADYAPITRIPLERAAFVKVTESLTLRDGVVTNRTWNRPSSVAGLVGIPLGIAQKIVKLPTEILQFKFDISSAEQKLLDEERKRLDQQRKDEDAYYSAVSLARLEKLELEAAIEGGDSSAIQKERREFVNAAITANATARKIGVPIPFPEVEGG